MSLIQSNSYNVERNDEEKTTPFFLVTISFRFLVVILVNERLVAVMTYKSRTDNYNMTRKEHLANRATQRTAGDQEQEDSHRIK